MSSHRLQVVTDVRVKLLPIENVLVGQSTTVQHGVLYMNILIGSAMDQEQLSFFEIENSVSQLSALIAPIIVAGIR